MSVNDSRKAGIDLTAFDKEGNELTSTISIDVEQDAHAIELWQYLRKQAEKWLVKKYDRSV